MATEARRAAVEPAVAPLGAGALLRFWAPLASTWLMMAVEGPFLAAIIARLPDATFNLAAHGVAFALAILVEAPVIMMMTASTALVVDGDSLRRLRRFTYALNAILTAVMIVLALPAVFRFVGGDLIGLPDEVVRLSRIAILLLLPWPAAIGYRRFYQGLLIRDGRTRRVAYGTVVRLTCMSTTALVLFHRGDLPGAWVGALAMSVGVCAEAVASRLMVHGTLQRLRRQVEASRAVLTLRRILRFYWPLALTSLLGLAVQPLVTFFVGHAPHAIESLAVLPVVHSLSFIFRSLGLSYQEVVIAQLGPGGRNLGPLSRFATALGLAASGCMALLVFTPMSRVWFEGVSGLSPELAAFAVPPAQVLSLMPALSVLLSWQRGLLVHGGNTTPISWATGIEVLGIAGTLEAGIRLAGMVGATAAALGFVVGRVLANVSLVPACIAKLRRDAVWSEAVSPTPPRSPL